MLNKPLSYKVTFSNTAKFSNNFQPTSIGLHSSCKIQLSKVSQFVALNLNITLNLIK